MGDEVHGVEEAVRWAQNLVDVNTDPAHIKLIARTAINSHVTFTFDTMADLLTSIHDFAWSEGMKLANRAVLAKAGVASRPEEEFWDHWVPGDARSAARSAEGGLRRLLDGQNITIQGMNNTTLDRLGNALARGLTAGDSTQSMARDIQDIIADPSRADMISRTEVARAVSESTIDTYTANGIEQVDWLTDGDPCAKCVSNAEMGPYDIGTEPELPAHPNCMCAFLPIVTLPNGDSIDIGSEE